MYLVCYVLLSNKNSVFLYFSIHFNSKKSLHITEQNIQDFVLFNFFPSHSILFLMYMLLMYVYNATL